MTPFKKRFAFFGAGALALLAAVLSVIPQTSPFGAPLKDIAHLAREAAGNIPDTCPFPCDAGTIMPLDGGVRGVCECGG